MHRPLLSDDELQQYHRDGYVVLGRVLDDDERQALLAAEERHRPDWTFALDGREHGLLVREQLCAESAAVRRFCIDGAHIPLLAQVLGPDVAFTHTQFITKMPERDPAASATEADSWIPLHQDDGYGRLEPPDDVTVWTALTDTNEENGCLVVAPRSHLGGLVDHDAAASNPMLREAGSDDLALVALPLAAGEAVLFSGLTLHGSGPNRSGQPRVGMHARYCHPSVRMVTHRDKPVLVDRHSWMVLGEAPADAWG
jgi:ectoine hydroxylase-related dioxygenase (phytanoyl-CoA dioxygenase family)